MKHSTLFIDESGKSSLAEKANEPFLLTGVILDEEDVKTAEGFFTYIKRKYEINTDKPFHSYDLFENPDTKISYVKSRPLLKTIADFISLIPIKIQIISIDKKLFKDSLGIKTDEDFKYSSDRKEMKEFPYRIMSAHLYVWFAGYLKTSENIGEILVDARRGGDYQLIKSLNLCKDPSAPIDKDASQLIKEKCNAICFAEKNFLSGGLEITDLISFTAFFHARRTMSSMNETGLPFVWKDIKNKLPSNKLTKLNKREIRKFFGVGRDGFHKNLKNLA